MDTYELNKEITNSMEAFSNYNAAIENLREADDILGACLDHLDVLESAYMSTENDLVDAREKSKAAKEKAVMMRTAIDFTNNENTEEVLGAVNRFKDAFNIYAAFDTNVRNLEDNLKDIHMEYCKLMKDYVSALNNVRLLETERDAAKDKYVESCIKVAEIAK